MFLNYEYDKQAYDLGFSRPIRKKDGTFYTIDDLIKDRNITDPKIIAQIMEDYNRGLKDFRWANSCIS